MQAADGKLHLGQTHSQQHKGHPMVKLLDISGKLGTEKPANQRHQCLKSAKPNAAGDLGPDGGLFHSQSLAHGHCESVHTQTHCQQQEFTNSHSKIPP